MLGKIAFAGATAAIIVGAGTAALAASGSSGSSSFGLTAVPAAATSSSTPSTPATKPVAKHPKLGTVLRRGVEGQVVTRGKNNTFVTHDEVRGVVTAVSATSISVKAANGVSETFVVNTSTKVLVRTNGKGATSAIADVHTGTAVVVLGTGATTRTATHIVAGVKH